MKKLNLFSILFVGMALLASGCHRHPVNPTPMPGMGTPENQPNNNTTPGQPLPPETPVTSTTSPNGNIPEGGNGPYAALLSGPHNEDRSKFAADTVYFDFDRATIKSSEESKLQDIAAYFKNNTTDALIIEGNCDERGTEKYNLSLGERRALSAREYLANLQVDPQRIKTVTYGASKPADPGHNEEAWKKNRRDEMVLVTPK